MPRLTAEHSTPLPAEPYLREFEDELMEHLAQNSLGTYFDPLNTYDHHRIFNLCARYRAVPETLEDDERGLLYACLSLALHMRMPVFIAHGAPKPATREDITYFRMSLEALTSWNRPSVTAVCAYRPTPSYVTSSS